MDGRDETQLPPSPELKANFISRTYLLWVFPFLRRGAKKDLNYEDLYHALPEDSAEKLGLQMEEKWNEELTLASLQCRRPRLWKVIMRIIWVPYALIGVGFAFEELVLRTIPPLALRGFIKSFNIENPDDHPNLRQNQFIYASLLVFVAFCNVTMMQKLMTSVIHMGLKVRLGVSSLLYRKILNLRKSDSDQANVGKLCNLLSSDVGRLNQSFAVLHVFYIAPIQLVLYTYLLYNEIGYSCFGGIGCILFLLPVQVLIGRFSMYFRVRIAKRTDERGRFLNEIIGGIRLIKMYAWEKPFANIISNLRKKEIKFIRRSLYLRGMYVSVHSIAAKLIPFCALIIYVALGNRLTASKAFFSIAVFNTVLQVIMNRLPTAASMLGEMVASLNRLEEFLLAEDNKKQKKDERVIKKYKFKENGTIDGEINEKEELLKNLEMDQEPKIIMRNYSASWNEEQRTLKNLTVDLKGNMLVMVVGHVGCGKSSFLNAILSELPVTSGDGDDDSFFSVQGQLSYASQETWIFPATIRQNILFGLEMDDKRYWKIIEMCCLKEDLKQWPDGDMTLVGEKGVTLSGGQKARVNLARAVYQQADIYLMDDPLSAVDIGVGKRLFDECFKGFLEGKLRILVTHQLQFLPNADYIIVLNREGEIWGQGTYQELINSEVDFTSLIGEEFMGNGDIEDVDELQRKAKGGILRRLSSKMSQEDKEDDKQNGKNSNLTEDAVQKKQEERKDVGSVDMSLYLRYFRSGGSYLAMGGLVVGFVVSQLLFNFTDYWLSRWTNEVAEGEGGKGNFSENVLINGTVNEQVNSEDHDFFSYVYCGLMGGFIVMSVFRSLLFFRYCMKISINLHDGMFSSIVRAPVKFFSYNPSGRIMNRFTKDLNSIDEALPLAFFDFVNILLVVLGMLVINIWANYYALVPSVILLVGLWKLRGFYLKSARDLKRIESVAKSPLFTHVTMSVHGLTTIRALKAEERMQSQFQKIQDTHTSVFYMMFMTGRWFAMTLEMMSVIFLAMVTIGFLFLTTSTQGGNVGVAISTILSLAGALQWGIRQSAETENYMTSVQRVFEYSNLKPEAPLENPKDTQLQNNWPSQGRLTFNSISLSYSDNDDPKVLKNISFSTQPHEKIGIVGRTGAGKSSLITALFRLTEPCNGTITIDNISTGSVGLHTLRSRISIIPQDPVLFTGSLRYNLDPFEEFKDDQLWEVLKEVDLHHAVLNLDCFVCDGGSNFSVGQRQLVCLARAILRKNRILVLDEATANVDPATDQLVQHTIRTKFSECTILTIAHRLQTVMDNDRVMVLDVGKIVEFDSPKVLMKNEQSLFYAMLRHSKKTEAK